MPVYQSTTPCPHCHKGWVKMLYLRGHECADLSRDGSHHHHAEPGTEMLATLGITGLIVLIYFVGSLLDRLEQYVIRCERADE